MSVRVKPWNWSTLLSGLSEKHTTGLLTLHYIMVAFFFCAVNKNAHRTALRIQARLENGCTANGPEDPTTKAPGPQIWLRFENDDGHWYRELCFIFVIPPLFYLVVPLLLWTVPLNFYPREQCSEGDKKSALSTAKA